MADDARLRLSATRREEEWASASVVLPSLLDVIHGFELILADIDVDLIICLTGMAA
jgi:hypothetical protein